MNEIAAMRQKLDEAGQSFELSERFMHMTTVEKRLLLRFLKADGMVLLARWQGFPDEELFKLRPISAMAANV